MACLLLGCRLWQKLVCFFDSLSSLFRIILFLLFPVLLSLFAVLSAIEEENEECAHIFKGQGKRQRFRRHSNINTVFKALDGGSGEGDLFTDHLVKFTIDNGSRPALLCYPGSCICAIECRSTVA